MAGMTRDQIQLEALKLYKDYAVWLIGIETLLLSALGFILKDALESTVQRYLIIGALGCFLASIFSAAWLLAALPAAAQKLLPEAQDKPPSEVENITAYKWYLKIPLYKFSAAEHIFFMVGVALVVSFIAARVVGW